MVRTPAPKPSRPPALRRPMHSGQHADRKQQTPLTGAYQGTHDGPEPHTQWNDAGHETADPAALGRGHEFLHQRQVHAIEAADAGADKETHDRQIDPAVVRGEIEQAGRDREVEHGADEDHAAADPVRKPAPRIGADDSADARTHEHDGGLTEGELPRPDQEGEHEADQEVIEEFERIADNGGSEDPDLVAGQGSPAIEYLEHGVSPWRMFDFGRASRHRTA